MSRIVTNMTYCHCCGVLAGGSSASGCPINNGHHLWVDADERERVYCKCCGRGPGVAGGCSVNSTHIWVHAR